MDTRYLTWIDVTPICMLCESMSLYGYYYIKLLISYWACTNVSHTFHFQIAINGQSFNRSARDAWELFQSTGVEALVAYDCSGAVLLMSTILGGLITGTCTGVWTYFKQSDKAIMVGSTSMLMGMILVSSYGHAKSNWNLQGNKDFSYWTNSIEYC